MMNFSSSARAAAVALLALVGTQAYSATIFTDSFESPVNSRNWQVYPDAFGDWTSTIGTGIEIQTSGVVVNAHDGNQYVELDSDANRGGDGTAPTTNSSMTRILNLTAGTYTLEWFYQARTGRNNDNGIEVYLSGRSEASLLANLIGSSDGRGQNGWVRQTTTFMVDGTDNDYALTFLAGGRANTLGGFVDSVTLSSVPLPAGLPLLLVGAAALGLAGRRKKR